LKEADTAMKTMISSTIKNTAASRQRSSFLKNLFAEMLANYNLTVYF
jgi:hypothetical protein